MLTLTDDHLAPKLCVVGYGLIESSPAVDDVVKKFYTEVIGEYWDTERKYIDKHYQSIPFPFDEIETPRFVNQHQWNLQHLIGYLNMVGSKTLNLSNNSLRGDFVVLR